MALLREGERTLRKVNNDSYYFQGLIQVLQRRLLHILKQNFVNFQGLGPHLPFLIDLRAIRL